MGGSSSACATPPSLKTIDVTAFGSPCTHFEDAMAEFNKGLHSCDMPREAVRPWDDRLYSPKLFDREVADNGEGSSPRPVGYAHEDDFSTVSTQYSARSTASEIDRRADVWRRKLEPMQKKADLAHDRVRCKVPKLQLGANLQSEDGMEALRLEYKALGINVVS
eukprot:gnl/TRDRNA2_/TRDRNA2_83533_c0_seq1.p1 gnl/TRDRNA2_/TRDRNA2_83533_c0~~gnl/TRDRNA2_/TRDRNA2_83533_c0_seq1.p1  ORF type:complete len:164 (+),score=29.41 gnl/TRDRNA2_/TRDRNA2_83533_c0_seq1:16-507(+)